MNVSIVGGIATVTATVISRRLLSQKSKMPFAKIGTRMDYPTPKGKVCMTKTCKNCGHATYYKGHRGNGQGGRLECTNGIVVDKNGVCDRWIKDVTCAEVMRRIDKEIKRIDKIPPSEFQLKVRPNFGENYRIVGA